MKSKCHTYIAKLLFREREHALHLEDVPNLIITLTTTDAS